MGRADRVFDNYDKITNTFGTSSCETKAKDEAALKESRIECFTLGTNIGRGAYAVVKFATENGTGKTFAVKVYEKYRIVGSQRKSCVNREISVLKRLDHPNIIKLYETIDTAKQLYLVMELVKGRSMLNYVRAKSGRKFEEAEGIRLFKQVVEGISFCHRQNVAHRDIKMENLLIDQKRNVKIIDFGFSVCAPPGQKLKIYCGTPSYMAPEIVGKRDYCGPPADMWSLGVLFFVMLCGSFPFKGATELELYRNISKGLYSVPVSVSSPARYVICKLLNLDPHKRPTADEVTSLCPSL